MRKMKPQKQLLQLVMLALLSVVSVLVTSNESFAALQCYNCHGNNVDDALPGDTPPGLPASYRNITTGAVKGNHQTHLKDLNITTANQSMCARCHNNSGYTSSHRSGTITLNKSINTSPAATNYVGGGMSDGGTFLFKNQTSVPTLGTCSNVNCHFEAASPSWGADPAATTCSTCHLATPTTGSHNKHLDATHATFGCNNCHAPRPAGSFQHATSAGNAGRNIDLNGTSMVQANYGAAGTVSNYQYLPSQTATRAFGDCSNVYCHSAGQNNGGTGPGAFAPAPVWGDPAPGCGSCHAINLLSTGTHNKHIAKSTNCGNCHTGATAGTYTNANHVNSQIDVAASTSYSQSGTPALYNGYGTCATATCHSSGQNASGNLPGVAGLVATWGGGALSCASCHKNFDTDPTAYGSHVKHAQTEAIACAVCHNGYTETTATPATHGNGNTDLSFSGAGNGTTYSQGLTPALGGGYGSCTTSVCHSSGQAADGSASPLTFGTVTWGAGALGCGSCHLDMNTNPAAPGTHVKHAQGLLNIACATCHGGYTETTTNPVTHSNGSVNLAFTGPGSGMTYSQTTVSPLGNGFGTCSATACHSSGQAADGGPTALPGSVVPTWGGTTLTCGSCHKNMDTDATAPGTHVKHAQTAAISCATCHNGYTETTAAVATHADGSVNLSFTGTGAGTTYSQTISGPLGNGYGTCSTSACHSSGQAANGTAGAIAGVVPTWGGAALNCGSCHQNMDTSGTATGSHVIHAQTKAIACATCHNGYTETTVVPATHVDGSVNLAFVAPGNGTVYSQGAVSGLGNGFGTCSTSACHSSGQAADGSATPLTYGVVPTWGGAALGCASCHKNMKTDLTAPGSHVRHAQTAAISCATCHNGYTETTATPATHGNGNTDLSFSGAGNGTTYSQGLTPALGNGFGTCSASSCHSSAQGPAGLAAGTTFGAPTWGGVAMGCASCHKNFKTDPTAYGSHVIHAQTKAIACATCHNGYTETTVAAATHVNGAVNLSFVAPGTGTVYSQGTAGVTANGYGTCSTSACHSSGQAADGTATPLTYGVVPTWGGAALGCASCHKDMNTDPTAPGTHVKHAQGATTAKNIACAACHSGYTETAATPATHGDGSINLGFNGVAAGTSYSQGVTSVLGNGFGTCTTNCHNSPAGYTPAFTAPAVTWGSAPNCAGCHGYPPNPAAPGSNHFGVAAGTCHQCHSTVNAGGTITTSTFNTPALHVDGIVQGGSCDACHGYPPVKSLTNAYGAVRRNGNYSSARLENYSGGGGVHDVAGHLLPTLKESQGLKMSACTACHPDTFANSQHNQALASFGGFSTKFVQVVVDPKFKFDKNRPIVYNGNRISGTKTSGTCANVECHFRKSPVWSTTYGQGH